MEVITKQYFETDFYSFFHTASLHAPCECYGAFAYVMSMQINYPEVHYSFGLPRVKVSKSQVAVVAEEQDSFSSYSTALLVSPVEKKIMLMSNLNTLSR